MRTVYALVGQGAQYYNMGKGWFLTNPVFASWMKKADDLMQKRWGRSLLNSLYTETRSILNPMEDLALSHPALFAVQYAAAMCVEKPIDLVLGSSLGEFVAMTVAGALSFESAFCHILDQVELFQQSFVKGKMIVVLDTKENIETFLYPLRGHYAYAAESGPQNFTLSMPLIHFDSIKEQLTIARSPHITLPIEYPFHSEWIDPIAFSFGQLASKLALSPISIPLVSCTSLSIFKQLIPNNLWNTLRAPIQIEQALRLFLQEGDQIIDCSPSGAIKSLLRVIFGNDSPWFTQAQSLMSPFNPLLCLQPKRPCTL